jgi:hypothetical protein
MRLGVVQTLYAIGRAMLGVLTLVILLGLSFFVGSHESVFLIAGLAVVSAGALVVLFPAHVGYRRYLLTTACAIGALASLVLAYIALRHRHESDVALFHVVHSAAFVGMVLLGLLTAFDRR